jgi:Reverse transcriptase (RNA-dependent DNA polymerase)/gag-polypeptide of LTR copia-type/Integrase core domain
VWSPVSDIIHNFNMVTPVDSNWNKQVMKVGFKLETFNGEGGDNAWREWKLKFIARADIIGTAEAYSNQVHNRYLELVASTSVDVDAEKAALIKKDKLAYAELLIITKGTPNYIVGELQENQNCMFKAEAAWIALTNKYEQRSIPKKMELKRQYTNAKMSPGQDPDDFMRDQDYIRQELRRNGHAISDNEFLQDCVLKLPEKVYSEFITMIEMDLDNMTLDQYKTQVRAFYSRKVKNSSTSLAPSALMAAGSRFGGVTNSNEQGGRPFKGTCNYCKKIGHKKADCRKRIRDERSRRDNGDSAGGGGDSNRSRRSATVPALVTTGYHAGTASEPDKWVIDCGATQHVTGSVRGMVNLTKASGLVMGFDGKCETVTEVGELPVIIRSADGITINTRLRNVKVVPSIGDRSLFSVKAAMTTSGKVKINFDNTYQKGKPTISIDRHVIPTTEDDLGLYCIQFERSGSTDVDACYVSNSTMDINILHERMGHIQQIDIKRIAHQYGIKLTGSLHECAGCALGKSTRHAVPKQTDRMVDQPLSQVHTDFSGPVSVRSVYKGYTYMQVFVDAKTRAATVYFTQFKDADTAGENLEQYINEVVNPLGHNINVIRSDGGEAAGADFGAVCKQHDIRQEFTSAHTPQQNGIAEAFIRTITMRATTMLQAAKLDLSYWAFAITAATYAYNRTPHAALNGKSPLEALTGNKPSIEHIRTFGTLAFVHKEPGSRRKFEARSRPGILVGLDRHRSDNCYLVWIPSTKSLLRSIHVVIHEKTLYADHIKSNVSNQQLDDDSPLLSIDKFQSLVDDLGIQVEGVTERISPQIMTEEEDSPQIQTHTETPQEALASPIIQHNLGDAHDEETVNTTASRCNADDDLYVRDPAVTRSRGRGTTGIMLEKEHGGVKVVQQQQPQQRSSNDQHIDTGMLAAFIDNSIVALDGDMLDAVLSAVPLEDEPVSYDDALNTPDSEQWKAAMTNELNAQKQNQTFTEAELPSGHSAIKTKWVYKLKRNSAGHPIKYKARVVAKGFTQTQGVDFNEVFAPTAGLTVIRVLLSLAVQYQWHTRACRH